ncbi:Glycyl-glycine endopeptidase ALE-1 precursor [Hartmannibacter diazotrophicus]|uniref:Glycyl-glycine endopeptidase ALE-1 n=2 Tax=Hartmannibacter diazotrophicus TaxID=1482074 RepID=A0A2C9D6T8_9HYPH|nr:Glycyl-glycine endopeptidase ALE-1 precursor [Hartmannibacter diazotrophicus]
MAGAAVALVVCLGGGAVWLQVDWPAFLETAKTPAPASAISEDEQLVMSDQTDAPSFAPPVYVPRIVDLPGDPLLIRVGSGGDNRRKPEEVQAPEALSTFGVGKDIFVVDDELITTSEAFMASLPSSPQDFAFFQSQSQGSTAREAASSSEPGSVADVLPLENVSTSGAPVTVADEQSGGWDAGSEADPAAPEFEKTEIENTTSVVTIISSEQRAAATSDRFIRVTYDRPLAGILTGSGLAGGDLELALTAAKDDLDLETVEAGSVVALRLLLKGQGSGPSLAQMSLYHDGTYVGSLALGDDGKLGVSADPWIDTDLVQMTTAPVSRPTTRRYRLLDAIYSAGLRNSVPTAVVGETIMLLSRSHDLNVFAEPGDHIRIIYGKRRTSDGETGEHLLFASITTGQTPIVCYVIAIREGADLGCTSDGRVKVASVPSASGMVVPVKGVLAAGFGPQMHPLEGDLRIHKGVDWVAPVGTPVSAAFTGTVSIAGKAEGYGNFIKIDHGGGRQTSYAHLDRFAKGIAPGRKVEAGDLIGYVGSTGNSTGPHLHFELLVNGEQVDPLEGTGEDDGSAVAVLVDRIIHVESAGNAAAKNPMSTATGLGQFIESTWLRMVNTYRPDLAQSLPREELLALRTDPTLSREMVHNLAAENEAYLRSRQAPVSAGTLYLAHFLGPEGAASVLKAPDDADLASLLGAGVITANPFLTGMGRNDIIAWAEGKMTGRKAGYGTVQRTIVSKEFTQFQTAIASILVNEAPVSPL